VRNLVIAILLLCLTLAACKDHKEPANAATSETTTTTNNDKQEITKLVRQMLNWKESQGQFDLTPTERSNTDSIYAGLDLNKHAQNLSILKESGLCAQEFINNYDRLIRTIDKKIRTKQYPDWQIGDLPVFRFANDISPWCDCQDVPYDNPNPWDLVEITFKELSNDKATLTWTWGRSQWSKDFAYTVKTVKENGKWKIAYLQGFDLDEGIKKDGL